MRLEQLVELGDRGLALLVQVVLLHQRLDGPEERVEVEDERGELADGERAVAHHVAADEQQRGLAEQPDELGARAVRRRDVRGVVVGVAVVPGDVAVLQHVVAGPVEPGDHPHARQALGQVAEHVGDAVAHAVVALVGRRPEPQREPGEDGHDHEQREQRELDVVEEQHHGDDDHREPLQRELREPVLQQLLERLDVARHAGHDHARLLVGVVVEREALQVRERADAQFEHDARRDPSGGGDARAARHRGHDHREDGEDPDDRQRGPVVRRDAVVDALLAEERTGLDAQRFDEDQEEGDGHHLAGADAASAAG